MTACAFGGPDATTLYITTSRDGLGDAAEAEAGAVFAAETGVRGIAAHFRCLSKIVQVSVLTLMPGWNGR